MGSSPIASIFLKILYVKNIFCEISHIYNERLKKEVSRDLLKDYGFFLLTGYESHSSILLKEIGLREPVSVGTDSEVFFLKYFVRDG